MGDWKLEEINMKSKYRFNIKTLTLTSLLILLSWQVRAEKIPCKITRIIDGDTVAIEETLHGLPLSIRILGIDTAEKGKKAKCQKEAKLGAMATEFTTKTIKHAKKITCEFVKHDKYGGRLLGNIYIDGLSLADSLIKAKLAREYHGEKKQSWCN